MVLSPETLHCPRGTDPEGVSRDGKPICLEASVRTAMVTSNLHDQLGAGDHSFVNFWLAMNGKAAQLPFRYCIILLGHTAIPKTYPKKKNGKMFYNEGSSISTKRKGLNKGIFARSGKQKDNPPWGLAKKALHLHISPQHALTSLQCLS